MQSSLLHLSMLRPMAQPWRQPLIYLQHAGRRRHGWIMRVINEESLEGYTNQVGETQIDKQKVYKKDEQKEMPQMINNMRAMLRSIGNGEISISAYDTAWVARVKMDGDDSPQFPSSITWIVQNQLSDGSWGDEAFYLVHDRMINTLSCVIALKSWNLHMDKCERGLSFIRQNLWWLEDNELDDWMLAGFEITFPQLLEMANNLGLDVPSDDPALQAVYAKRDLKLARYWSEEGLPATRDNPVKDIDDTAMGFRLLRLHGYHVSPCVFKHFEKDGEFYCYPRESSESVTSMYSLYRASQVAFPGEDELSRAEIYSHEFLTNRLASQKLKDKWVIPKDLPGEVGYALDMPWKASLTRIETRIYLEQCGGSSDVWIGKVLYRMLLVNNDLLLQTAKADFRNFQRICKLEWHDLKEWCNRKNLQMYGVSPKSALQAYFVAAASIFEPNRATERLGWARTAVLAEAISSHFRCSACAETTRKCLIAELSRDRCTNIERGKDITAMNNLVHALDELVGLLSVGNASSDDLREAWKQWLMSWTVEDCQANAALLFVRTVEISSGRTRCSTEQQLNLFEYSQLEQLTTSICCKLGARVIAQDGKSLESIQNSNCHIDLEMKELSRCVLQDCSGINEVTRQTFLDVVKSYYYVAHCSPETVDRHISMVIFENVI